MIKAVFFDLEMLSGYENSVALGNADELVKKSTRFITKSNQEDGIAYVLQKLKEEGFIQTEERRPAVVIYQQEGLESRSAIPSVLEKRQVIEDVHQTMAY